MKTERREPERLEVERGRVLVEESREMVVVLDADARVVASSRRARESLPGVVEGQPLPPELRLGEAIAVPYEVEGRRETLLYLNAPGDLPAYEELRAGFTAAVSHELRTPLARLLALIETAELEGAETPLLEQARAEVEQIDELIAEVLFLSELETGREIVSLGTTRVLPVVEEVFASLRERAVRANVRLEAVVDATIELPLRARMVRVVVENLAANAIRYAGERATFVLSARRDGDVLVLEAADDGTGVEIADLPRLFERFFRGDRARSSRGSGLGLAIVKHVVTAAGGTVDATGGPGEGLRVRCVFPAH